MSKFTIIEYLQKQKATKEKQNQIVEEKKGKIATITLEVQQRYSTEEAIASLEREKTELEITLEQHQSKVNIAIEDLKMFRFILTHQNSHNTGKTDAEHIWENILVQHTNYQEQLSILIQKIEVKKEELVEMTSYEELESSIVDSKKKLEEAQRKIKSIEKEITSLQKSIPSIKAQQQLKYVLPEYCGLIYEYWNYDSKELILHYLQTEGDKKNCALNARQLNECIDFIEQVFYSFESEDVNQVVMCLEIFQEQMQKLFLPELIVAIAHTIRLDTFPLGFFDGKCGKIGLNSCSDGIYYDGVPLMDAIETLEFLEQPVPKKLQHIVNQDDFYSKRVFYSFQPESDNKNKSQISNLPRFLNEFWRFDNFLGFDHRANLYVHLEKQDEAQVQIDANKYVRTRQQQELYMDDFLACK